MKTSIFTLVSAALLVFSGAASAQIANTDHDLSLNNGQVCVYCHAPHTDVSQDQPLWNRQASGATYTMYSSATLDMTRASQPQGISLACLSCHDGTLAFDQLIEPPHGETLNQGTMTGGEKLGTDLGGDHPISVTYDTGADPGFVSAASGKVGTLPLFGGSSDQLECATCHSVHDNTNDPFLRVANSGSALCTTCHLK